MIQKNQQIHKTMDTKENKSM